MRAVFGLLLIMFGMAMAVVWMPGNDAERQLSVVTDIATKGLPGRSSDGDREARTFAPSSPLIANVEPPGQRGQHHAAFVARVVAPSPETSSMPAAHAARVTALPSVVTAAITLPPAAYGSNDPMSPRSGAAPAQSADLAAPEMSRYELVRSIQRELRRVGCYGGEVDGSWGPASRRAMSGFTERVNAILPTFNPDFILLTLLQGHQGLACSRTCPAGQSLSEDDRCVPNAILSRARGTLERAHAAAAPPVATIDSGSIAPANRATSHTNIGVTPSSVAAAVIGSATSRPAPLPGRMAVRGPVPDNLALQPEPSTARAAVQAEQSDASEPSARSGNAAIRRETTRRRAGRGSSRRHVYAQGAPYGVYRAPRPAPRYYAATTRRTSRAWTATFFATH